MGGFGYASREENRILFEKMLNECKKKECVSCVNAKGENFSTEALFLILIFEQQKMVNALNSTLCYTNIIETTAESDGLCYGWTAAEPDNT